MHHYDKLTDDERNDLMDKFKGTTSPASKLPARSPKAAAAFFSGHKISHNSKKGSRVECEIIVCNDQFLGLIQYFGLSSMGCFS